MTKNEVLGRARSRLEGLSKERLQVADDFLAYLEEREDNEATEELLRIPGLVERLRKAERQIAQGRTVPVEKLRRKYRACTR